MAPTTFTDRVSTQSFGDGIVGMLRLVGGPSLLNPAGMKKNCVPVTFAKIMEYPNVDEFWYATLGYVQEEDKGLIDSEIEDLLNRTKWEVRRLTYTSSKEGSAYHQQLYDFAKYTPDGLGPRCAAIYTRPDGTRHCVAASPDFMCYQYNDEGINVTKELEQAKSIVMYGLRCRHGTKEHTEWYDRFIWNKIEQRNKGISPAQKFLQSLSNETKAWLDRDFPQLFYDVKRISELGTMVFQDLEKKVPCPFVTPHIREILITNRPTSTRRRKGALGTCLPQ